MDVVQFMTCLDLQFVVAAVSHFVYFHLTPIFGDTYSCLCFVSLILYQPFVGTFYYQPIVGNFMLHVYIRP